MIPNGSRASAADSAPVWGFSRRERHGCRAASARVRPAGKAAWTTASPRGLPLPPLSSADLLPLRNSSGSCRVPGFQRTKDAASAHPRRHLQTGNRCCFLFSKGRQIVVVVPKTSVLLLTPSLTPHGMNRHKMAVAAWRGSLSHHKMDKEVRQELLLPRYPPTPVPDPPSLCPDPSSSSLAADQTPPKCYCRPPPTALPLQVVPSAPPLEVAPPTPTLLHTASPHGISHSHTNLHPRASGPCPPASSFPRAWPLVPMATGKVGRPKPGNRKQAEIQTPCFSRQCCTTREGKAPDGNHFHMKA
ncbi:uncharacterized protein LOC128782239 [Vidua chalybeata]|uniref:uncharacterized protein LOC128782239 n=1 Tax=Vidua chalybeata TaxID=81927 RepID=UPI0023A7A2E5|nr:uncharacterized protein LOC128782239 [Vidua chalybeata]